MHRLVVLFFMAIAALAIPTTPTSAETLTIDTTKMDAELVALIRAQQERGEKITIAGITADEANEYAQIGTAISGAIADTAGALRIEVNEFAQTSVGKLTMVLLVWKLIGYELVHIVFGTLMWAISTWIVVRSYNRHHLKVPSQYRQNKDGSLELIAGKPIATEWQTMIEMDERSRFSNKLIHLVAWVVMSALSAIITFSG